MQNNIGTVKIIRTNKQLDTSKPTYKERGKRHEWERLDTKRQQVESNK